MKVLVIFFSLFFLPSGILMAESSDLIIDQRTNYNKEIRNDLSLFYIYKDWKIGGEYFYNNSENDLISLAIRFPFNNKIKICLFSDSNKDIESKLAYKINNNLSSIVGFAIRESQSKIFFNSLKYVNGNLKKLNNFGFSTELVYDNERNFEFGAGIWIKLKGIFAGWGKYFEQNHIVIGIPKKNSFSMMYFGRSQDRTFIHNFTITPKAKALNVRDFLFAFEGNLINENKSIALLNLNPFRFRCDLNEMGKDFVFGIQYMKLRTMKSFGIRGIKYISKNLWFEIGYNKIQSEINGEEFIVAAGYTPNHFYGLVKGDLNIRFEFVYNKASKNKIGLIRLVKKF